MHATTLPALKAAHSRCRELAVENNVEFLGIGRNETYALFRQPDGQEFDLAIKSLLDRGWPAKLSVTLSNQRAQRARGEATFARIAAMGAEAGAEIQDACWKGPAGWYSFKLASGKLVSIRGTKLLNTGWPEDIEAYTAWSTARRRNHIEHRQTTDDLFEAFKKAVAGHGGLVTEAGWLGARVPHSVLLSDGTIRMLKPNQLQYIGWPTVPLDELRKLAKPATVNILPETANDTQVFRLQMAGGMYLEDIYIPLRRVLQEGAPAYVADAVAWAEAQNLTLVPARWAGLAAEYDFVEADGSVIRQLLPAAIRQAVHLKTQATLGSLRRVGNNAGFTLLSTETSHDGIYQWKSPAGDVVSMTKEQVIFSRIGAEKLAELQLRLMEEGFHAKLLSTEWKSRGAAYSWQLPTGEEVVATFAQMRSYHRRQARAAQSLTRQNSTSGAKTQLSMAAKVFKGSAAEMELIAGLKSWSTQVGLTLLSTQWRGPCATYQWTLPGNVTVEVPCKKMKQAVSAILKNRAWLPGMVEGTLTDFDLHYLRRQLRTTS